MKRLLILALAAVLIFSGCHVLLPAESAPTDASPQSEPPTATGDTVLGFTSYESFLQSRLTKSSPLYYTCHDLDSDGTDELLLWEGTTLSVYTTKKWVSFLFRKEFTDLDIVRNQIASILPMLFPTGMQEYPGVFYMNIQDNKSSYFYLSCHDGQLVDVPLYTADHTGITVYPGEDDSPSAVDAALLDGAQAACRYENRLPLTSKGMDTQVQNAHKLFADFLAGKADAHNQIGTAITFEKAPVRYAILDRNGDGVPELVADYGVTKETIWVKNDKLYIWNTERSGGRILLNGGIAETYTEERGISYTSYSYRFYTFAGAQYYLASASFYPGSEDTAEDDRYQINQEACTKEDFDRFLAYVETLVITDIQWIPLEN